VSAKPTRHELHDAARTWCCTTTRPQRVGSGVLDDDPSPLARTDAFTPLRTAIARRAGTTASANFIYWPSKEHLFLRVPAEVTVASPCPC
jgi:Bacterial regulatory proteins, tetR family